MYAYTKQKPKKLFENKILNIKKFIEMGSMNRKHAAMSSHHNNSHKAFTIYKKHKP